MAATMPTKGDKERDLRLAAQNGNLESVTKLLASGVNVNAYGENFKKTALHLAAQNGYSKIVVALLKSNANISLKDKDGQTACMLAELTNDDDHIIIAALLKRWENITPAERHKEIKTFEERRTQRKSQGYLPQLASQAEIIKIAKILNGLMSAQYKALQKIMDDYQKYIPRIGSSLQQRLFGEIKYRTGLLPKNKKQQFDEKFKLFLFADIFQQSLNEFDELLSFTASDGSMVLLLQTIYVNCIKARILVETKMAEIMAALENLATQEIPFSIAILDAHFNQDSLKEVKLLLQKCKDIFLEKTLKVVQEKFYVLLGSPKDFAEFISVYFSDIESLKLIAYEGFTELNTAKPDHNDDAFIDNQHKILDIINLYFEKCALEIHVLIQGSNYVSADTLIANLSFFNTVRTMRYNLETYTDKTHMKHIPQYSLLDCYMHGKNMIFSIRRIIQTEKFTQGQLQQHFEKHENAFLQSQKFKELPPLDWVSMRAKDKQIQKGIDAKKREECQAQKTQAQLRAFKLAQEKQAEDKEQFEKKAIAAKMLKKLAGDDDLINLTESILKNNNKVKIIDFCKLIILLEIPGSDAIKDPTMSPPDNKLTLHHLPHFEVFVTHLLHGTDHDEMIHPETVKKLKALLMTFGITKDNLTASLDKIKADKTQLKN